MRDLVYVQWSTNPPSGFVPYSTDALRHIAPKAAPARDRPRAPRALDTAPGWIHAVNIHGIVCGGCDFYHIARNADEIVLTAWADDPEWHAGFEYAHVIKFREPIRVPKGLIWTGERILYCTQAMQDRWTKGGRIRFEDLEFRPWADFQAPTVGHIYPGVFVEDDVHLLHKAAQAHHYFDEWGPES